MLHGQKIVVVLPAYNAARTVERTYRGLDLGVLDEVILVDDASRDETVAVARRLGLPTFLHPSNQGYGANQKSCYAEALRRGAQVVVMVHPDYQYEPRLAASLAGLVASGVYDCAIGSRIIGGGALKGGMPAYKYLANRALTMLQNLLLGQKLSEYHSGFRAYSRELLEALPLAENSADFLFDNQILAQAIYFNFRIGEISCPTRYAPDSSSIGFRAAWRYGLGVLLVSLKFRWQRWGLGKFRFLEPEGRRLPG